MADSRFLERGDIPGVYYRDSDHNSDKIYIVSAGIHPNERTGIRVVEDMISGKFNIPLEEGLVIAWFGNLQAEPHKRATQPNFNLNRYFRGEYKDPANTEGLPFENSYELKRARQLMPIMDGAQAAYDMHGFRPKDGQPFIITEPRGFDVARAIGSVPFISSGWNAIERGGTDGYMDEQGRIGICHELSQLTDLKRGVPRGMQGVLRFLSHLGAIAPLPPQKQVITPAHIHAHASILAGTDFAWAPGHPYKSFQSLEEGTVIAWNNGQPIIAGSNNVIIFPSSVKRPEPGEEMFNLGTKITQAW